MRSFDNFINLMVDIELIICEHCIGVLIGRSRD